MNGAAIPGVDTRLGEVVAVLEDARGRSREKPIAAARRVGGHSKEAFGDQCGCRGSMVSRVLEKKRNSGFQARSLDSIQGDA